MKKEKVLKKNDLYKEFKQIYDNARLIGFSSYESTV